MEETTGTSRKILLQDVGLLLMMICISVGAAITALGGDDLLGQHLAMLLGLFAVALLVVLRARITGTVAAAALILIFTVYKLYSYFVYETAFRWTDWIWPFLVIGTLGGTVLFISLYATVEGVNSVLNQRIDTLTVMDPLTGLENRRSMTRLLGRYMALSERNGLDMGLMLIRLRYAEELKKVLSRRQFNELRQNLASALEDTLRLEDRVFTIDDEGSFGIIYFSKVEGAPFIKNRILDTVSKRDMLHDMKEMVLRVELSIVYMQYDKEYGKDVLRFISEVEKEFAYEV